MTRPDRYLNSSSTMPLKASRPAPAYQYGRFDESVIQAADVPPGFGKVRRVERPCRTIPLSSSSRAVQGPAGRLLSRPSTLTVPEPPGGSDGAG